MLDQVLAVFDIVPDHDLDVMRPGQSLLQSASRILAALEAVLDSAHPDVLLVQGDTTTTLCGALAAFYKHIPVGHIEAGLRTGDVRQPFPEEMNRLIATRLANMHFAATQEAESNLLAEGVPAKTILVTGNPGIDAVCQVRDRILSGRLRGRPWTDLSSTKKTIVVTAHRRESFGEGFEGICQAIHRMAERPDVQIVYPVHPNPNVREPVERWLRGRSNVLLTDPLTYVEFVDLMQRSCFLLTDSGGVQEEGPSLGKPVLVMREKTERPEAVRAGTARLVGTDPERIVAEASTLLDDMQEYERRVAIYNPYGDGLASHRIADFIQVYFGKKDLAEIASFRPSFAEVHG
jgi:UDP-N-acetylglucosamine 2-epimerase (non-hydrolysing)